MPWSVAFMVVAIVLITAIARVSKERYRTAARQDAAVLDPDARAARDEVRALRERVQVLERVITENRSSLDLDAEIERLRDR